MVIKSDHHYPGSQGQDVTVILYAQLATPSFYEWHQILRPKAERGEITYILRHYIAVSLPLCNVLPAPDHFSLQNPAPQQVRLSGYGVELAIKSTEYKAKDDSKVEGLFWSFFFIFLLIIKFIAGQSAGKEEDDEDIEGFVFGRLK
jgi:UDP-glucose:glycoprotein glucosyltransferase